MSAARMARPLTPRMSVTTRVSFTLASSRASFRFHHPGAPASITYSDRRSQTGSCVRRTVALSTPPDRGFGLGRKGPGFVRRVVALNSQRSSMRRSRFTSSSPYARRTPRCQAAQPGPRRARPGRLGAERRAAAAGVHRRVHRAREEPAHQVRLLGAAAAVVLTFSACVACGLGVLSSAGYVDELTK